MIKIIVCGGRDFANVPNGPKHPNFIKRSKEYKFVQDILTQLRDEEFGECFVIQGEAKGVDTAAKEWAKSHAHPWIGYPANWDSYGKSAGHLRNKEMLDKESPDFVVAFPGGKGTENMVTQAKKRGIQVKRIKYTNDD